MVNNRRSLGVVDMISYKSSETDGHQHLQARTGIMCISCQMTVIVTV